MDMVYAGFDGTLTFFSNLDAFFSTGEIFTLLVFVQVLQLFFAGIKRELFVRDLCRQLPFTCNN